jgi:putative Mn2+ efflux pump MntP
MPGAELTLWALAVSGWMAAGLMAFVVPTCYWIAVHLLAVVGAGTLFRSLQSAAVAHARLADGAEHSGHKPLWTHALALMRSRLDPAALLPGMEAPSCGPMPASSAAPGR